MQVLLLEDVDKLGLAGDVVSVADGYARNFLMPRNLAKAATKGAQKEAEQIRKTGERKRARELEGAQGLAQRLDGVTIKFVARAGEAGKLYGSITTADMADALEEAIGEEVDRRKIASDSLRQLGEHIVQVRLMAGVSADVKVIIEAEESESSTGEVQAEEGEEDSNPQEDEA